MYCRQSMVSLACSVLVRRGGPQVDETCVGNVLVSAQPRPNFSLQDSSVRDIGLLDNRFRQKRRVTAPMMSGTAQTMVGDCWPAVAKLERNLTVRCLAVQPSAMRRARSCVAKS
jgi:hypothetical protein